MKRQAPTEEEGSLCFVQILVLSISVAVDVTIWGSSEENLVGLCLTVSVWASPKIMHSLGINSEENWGQ